MRVGTLRKVMADVPDDAVIVLIEPLGSQNPIPLNYAAHAETDRVERRNPGCHFWEHQLRITAQGYSPLSYDPHSYPEGEAMSFPPSTLPEQQIAACEELFRQHREGKIGADQAMDQIFMGLLGEDASDEPEPPAKPWPKKPEKEVNYDAEVE